MHRKSLSDALPSLLEPILRRIVSPKADSPLSVVQFPLQFHFNMLKVAIQARWVPSINHSVVQWLKFLLRTGLTSTQMPLRS